MSLGSENGLSVADIAAVTDRNNGNCGNGWGGGFGEMLIAMIMLFLFPMFFGGFGVVKAFERSHKIARYSAYAFESEIAVAFLSAALGACVAYYAGVSAKRVAVYGVIYRAVAYVALFHVANYFHKRFHVVHGVAVKLNIRYVPAVC